MEVTTAAAAAAAANSLQSCPTLCDPIDGSPRGSSVPGILQARILEWVAISLESKLTAELLTVQPPEGPTASARKQGHTLSKYKSPPSLDLPSASQRLPLAASSPETGLPGNPSYLLANIVEASVHTK